MAISTTDYRSLLGRKVINQNKNVGVVIDIDPPTGYNNQRCIRVCVNTITIWYDYQGYKHHGKRVLEITLLEESELLAAELACLMNIHSKTPEQLIALLLEEHC